MTQRRRRMSHQWYNLAAANPSPGLLRNEAAKARDALAATMTPTEIVEAQRRAYEWKPKDP